MLPYLDAFLGFTFVGSALAFLLLMRLTLRAHERGDRDEPGARP